MSKRPSIRKFVRPEKPEEFPAGIALEAGHLVVSHASWRTVRPEIDPARCAGCGLCYLACPDGAIVSDGDKAGVDLVYCKGCGICVRECRLGAIEMVDEHD